jgi:hypothetical protein
MRKLLLAVVLLSSCGLPPMISDTGYRGTWSRGNDRNLSIVAIAEVDGRWYFRWTKRSFDRKFAVLCDWEGRCEERLNGALIATYAIKTTYDAANGTLGTETVEERLVPDKQIFRYTDVMAVTENGRTLWNYTVDRDGQVYKGNARPMRSFSKVANSVADPPRGTPR